VVINGHGGDTIAVEVPVVMMVLVVRLKMVLLYDNHNDTTASGNPNSAITIR